VRLVQKVHTENGGVLEPPVEFIETKAEPDYDAFIIKKSETLCDFLGGLRDKALAEIEYKLKEELGPLLGFKVRKEGVIRIGRSTSQEWIEPDEIDVEEFNRRRDKLVGIDPEAALKLCKKEKEIADSVPYFYGIDNHENQIILEEFESEVRNHFRSTKKNYRNINCDSWNGKEVYSHLTKKAYGGIYIPIPGYLEGQNTKVPFYESILFDYNGTVFLNNLSCDPESGEDYKYYCHLASIIKKGRMGPEDNLLQEVNPINPENQYKISANWVVIYTDDLDAFPDDFREPLGPFIEIPLGDEIKEKNTDGFAGFRSTSQSSDYGFFLNGEYWKITYEGKTISLKNSIGLQYIHYLLENPNVDFTPTELLGKVSKVTLDAYRKLGEQQERKSSEDDSVKKRPDGIPFGQVLTDEAREELMKRYNKLKSDLEDDTEIKCDEEVVEIEKEMKLIVESLKTSIDKDGKSRNFADITERNRRSVSKAINESLDKIKDEKNGIPALWRHFDIKLKSGTSCFYKPKKPIPWNL
jgi:hypothetical protein